MPGVRVADRHRRLTDVGEDLALGVAVVVMWVLGTALFDSTVGGSALLATPGEGQHGVAMWCTAMVIALRRSVSPWVLLATVPLYVLVLGPPVLTEFHLLPVLIVAYTVAQSGRVHPVVAGAVCVLATAALFEIVPSWDDSGALWWIPLVGRDFIASSVDNRFDWSRVLFSLFTVVGVTFLGALVREQRRTAAALASRNEELERLRQVEAQQIVLDERTRIARELHDVVAHHVSAIVIRAQAAERLAPQRPEVAVEAVGWIAEAGKEALTGMRHTVQVLRTSGAGEVALAPQATLADLRGIVARLAPTGLDVSVDLPDPLPELDPLVDLAAVRIAQEALTNALRHAEARRAVVAVHVGASQLVVTVDDDGTTGRAPTTKSTGQGLRGMAERAAACGGRFGVGRSDLGGWSVRATLPLVVVAPTRGAAP